MRTTARILFVLCLPVLLLTASVTALSSSPALYEHGFEKYGISQVTGLAPSELDKVAAGLADYFNSGEEDIDITVVKNGTSFQLFSEREVAHMRDVKGLIGLAHGALAGSLLYALAFVAVSLFWWRDRRLLAGGLVGGSALTVLLMGAMGLAMLFNFDQFFLQFHLLSFTNDFWLLDPTRDYLIMLFPSNFFYDTFLLGALITGGMALILGGVGWYLLRRPGMPATT